MTKDPSDITERISLAGIDPLALLGLGDANLKVLQNSFRARISARGDEIVLQGKGPEIELITSVILHLREQAENGVPLAERDVAYAIDKVMRQRETGVTREKEVQVMALKRLVKPKSEGQAEYMAAIQDHDLVVAIGPAGTGKTYLAVAAAVAALNERQVERIVLCRPAVEAGESLGFLPGDFKEKIDPYMRPLYDSLYDMMSQEKANRYLLNDVIEIVPLAYMRGRTLNNAFMILDEAQNATRMQMKMFLTRMGFNSRAVVTGDITQIDLAHKSESGLVDIQEVLQGVEGIKFVRLGERDVVRHKLVHRIIQAYQISGDKNGGGAE
ncbi:MAG TPA: PhoH family protein [Candidatus Edwardsbacteria bacterium]|nr:PhoH family protein [Candidatus Edwardsbacteria bacterium]